MKKVMGYGVMALLLSLLTASMVFSDNEKILVYKNANPYADHAAPTKTALALLREYGAANGFSVDTTVNRSSFNSETLSKYQAVVALNPMGQDSAFSQDTMNSSEQTAFKDFILSGKGFMGFHCFDRLNNDWEWYLKLVGVQYIMDYGPLNCTFHVADIENPLTKDISQTFTNSQQVRHQKLFFSDTSKGWKIWIKADQKDFKANEKQKFYPYVWTHEFEGARIWCGNMGHTAQTYSSDQIWRKLVLRGILYALNRPGYGPTVSVLKSSLPHLVPRETKSELEGCGTIRIYDLSGRMISGMRESSIPHNIPVQDNRMLPSGIYIIAPHSAGSSHGVFRMSSTQ